MRDRDTEPLRPALCRWLRWKSMYLDRADDPNVPSMEDGFVWCVHTMNCLGPDGDVASREDCVAGRSCHASARSVETKT